MQFVEASDLGVRVAIYRLTPRGAGPEFRLFPMIHAGSKEYYADVSRRLESCDLIFLEGVSSWRVAYLTWTYKVLAKSKRMALVTQRSLDLSALRRRIVNTDVTTNEFDRSWGHVPWWVQALIALFVPMYIAYIWLYGTRAYLARYLDCEDLPSRDEVLVLQRAFPLITSLTTVMLSRPWPTRAAQGDESRCFRRSAAKHPSPCPPEARTLRCAQSLP